MYTVVVVVFVFVFFVVIATICFVNKDVYILPSVVTPQLFSQCVFNF